MTGSLTLSRDGVAVGVLTPKSYHRVGRLTVVNGLHPGLRVHETPPGENFAQVRTFLSHFLDVDGNYPASDFRVPGWINYAKK
jgi:hypothetical protein